MLGKRYQCNKYVTKDKRPKPTKPVFKIKDEKDGTKCYKAKVVTNGFLMISRVDYTKFFSLAVGIHKVHWGNKWMGSSDFGILNKMTS